MSGIVGYMRLFIFLGIFYAFIVVFGITSSQAATEEPCTGIQCVEENINLDAELNEDEIISKLQALLDSIEDKVSMEKLHGMIQKAAEQNAQVAELLKLVQEYGVLTEIKLDDPANE